MKRHLITGAIIILLTLSLSGCINSNNNIVNKNNNGINNNLSEEDKFIGRWESEDNVILIFEYNNECSMEGLFQGSGEWELKEDTLHVTLEYTDGQNFMAFSYIFSDDNTVLTLIDPGERGRTYYKK